MAEAPPEELRDLLFEARVASLEFARRTLSITRARDMERAWVNYFTRKYEETKATRDKARLEEHQARLGMYDKRLQIYSLAGRYARTRDPEDLLRMRFAQRDYYEAKAKVLEVEKPEEAERLRRELVPPPELYKEWEKAMEEVQATEEAITSACRRYKEDKVTGEWYRISGRERFMRTRIIQRLYIERYEKAEEAAEVKRILPDIIREWREKRGF